MIVLGPKQLRPPYRVLIVDDHKFVVEMLAQRLSADPKVTLAGTANRGSAAIHIVRNEPVDIVLLDMELDNESGIDVAKEMLQINPRLRIVGLSVHDSDYYPIGLLEAGGVGFLSKKANGKEIIEGIRRVAAGEMVMSPGIAVFIATNTTAGGLNNLLNLLTPKEIEVLILIAKGHSVTEMAEMVGVSCKTIQTHRNNLRKKLKVKTDVELCLIAIKAGLINL